MNFDFSDEQNLLRDTVTKLLADTYSFDQRKAYLAATTGRDPAIWQTFAETGLTALTFSEDDGGIGGGTEETMIVMEAFGKALAVEPFLPTMVIGGALLNTLASAEQRADLIPGIVAGETTLAFAHEEPGARYDDAPTTRATESGGRILLNGVKTRVLHADSATHLLVSASTADGIGIFLLSTSAPGVTLRAYPTQDGMRAADITLNEAVADQRIGGSALVALRHASDIAIAALCAEAVGAMQASLDLTVDYLKTRKQFGRAIGDFQGLQHRAAEMVVELEQARSMMMYAAMMARESDEATRARAISAAKIQIGQSARFIGQSAIQLHGGIGMTAEYPVGAYFKRLTMIEKAFGDTDWHIGRLASLGGV